MKVNHGLEAIRMPSREEPKDKDEEQNGRSGTTIWRPIAAQLRFVDHDVPGAIHGLGAVGLTIDVHSGIHILAVAFQVTANSVQLFAGNVGREDEIVAPPAVLSPPEVLDYSSDGG